MLLFSSWHFRKDTVDLAVVCMTVSIPQSRPNISNAISGFLVSLPYLWRLCRSTCPSYRWRCGRRSWDGTCWGGCSRRRNWRSRTQPGRMTHPCRYRNTSVCCTPTDIKKYGFSLPEINILGEGTRYRPFCAEKLLKFSLSDSFSLWGYVWTGLYKIVIGLTNDE